jgi:hypothetical protein
MKDQKNIEKKRRRKTMLFISALVIGMMFSYVTFWQNVSVVQDEDTRSWHVIWEGSLAEAGEADPGAGNSGILEIFIYETGGTYTTNLTEGDASTLGWASADATEIDVAHSTAFDVVVKVRGNATHCKRDAVWFNTDLRVRITWSDESLTDEVCEMAEIENNTANTYLWLNFYIDNSDSGYTLSKSQTTEIQNIKFEAYY